MKLELVSSREFQICLALRGCCSIWNPFAETLLKRTRWWGPLVSDQGGGNYEQAKKLVETINNRAFKRETNLCSRMRKYVPHSI